jgi:transposase-like protein
MAKPIDRDSMYRKRAFDADIIELCARWYLTYRLSCRDLVEMMAGRDVETDMGHYRKRHAAVIANRTY